MAIWPRCEFCSGMSRRSSSELFLHVHRVLDRAACLSLKTFLKSPEPMRAGEVAITGWCMGQGVLPRGYMNCREDSLEESESASDDLSDTDTASCPGDWGEERRVSKSALFKEFLAPMSMEMERGGGVGTQPADRGGGVGVNPVEPYELRSRDRRSNVPSNENVWFLGPDPL